MPDGLSNLLGTLDKQTVTMVCVLVCTWKTLRLERKMHSVIEELNLSPRRKGSPMDFLLMFLLAVFVGCLVVLSSGCVRTHMQVGNAVLDRTALLTHVSVPNIEMNSNGTFKASLDSDARTELLEAVLKALAAAPK